MAAPPIVVERFRVEHGSGFTMSVISLPDRRAAGNQIVRFVYQRHLEAVLYGRVEGTSGPIWKLMNQSGMGSTAMPVNKASTTSGVLTDAEYTALMAEFRSSLPGDMVDPSSLGRIRNCTIIPVAAAASIVRTFGRSGPSMAWLRAFNQPVPQAWQLVEEQEENDAAGEADLVLNEQLDEQGFEAEDFSFADELTMMATFSTDQEDDERLKTYILQRVPPLLKSDLDLYLLARTATFAARRHGGAVQSISAESDRTALLRFYGYLERMQRVPAGADLYISLLCRADLGDLVEGYATWLQNNQRCKFSTIANYLNGLVSLTNYAYANFEPAAAVLNMEPNPLTQLINLRAQAETASKTQQLYDKRVGGWLEWEDVQKARVAAMNKLNDAAVGGTAVAKMSLLRDAAAISLLSLIPPDRVGCIRKLKLSHTLKRKEGGGWMMDLSKQRDGHKTSRFYGPFAASLPAELTAILDRYAIALELEVGGENAYLFHPPHGSNDRPMESAAWTGWVKRLFKRHHGEEVAPKTLRSSFITWLRGQDAAPQILKSAAHAMKHSETRQASSDYDQESDDRLVKAAYEFNLTFAAGFAAAEVALAVAGGEGGSSSAPPPLLPPAPPPLPPPPAPQQQVTVGGTHILPPIAATDLTTQLADIGFARSAASKNGDCYPLSAMAGFEIPAYAARNPTAQTTARVRQLRQGSIELLVADTVGGVDSAVFLASEKLPADAHAAAAAMANWREPGFWFANDGNKSASFQFGVAAKLERPVVVIEKMGKTFLDPARIYGARDATTGELIHSVEMPGAPETVPSYGMLPIADLLAKLQSSPTGYSLVEFNGSNHFNPWLLKPSLRKAAAAAADLGVESDDHADGKADVENDDKEVSEADEDDAWDAESIGGAAEVAGEESGAAEAAVKEGGEEAAGEEDGEEAAGEEDGDECGEWVQIEGAPFIATLVRGGPRTTAPTRTYEVTIPFNSDTAPIYVGGKVKFPVVAGAPADGIVCDFPESWPESSKELTFTLKLDRAGATEDSVTINNALYLKGKAEDKEAQLATEPNPPAPPTPLEQPLPPPLEQPAPEAVLPDVVRSSTRSRKRARLSHPPSEAVASEPVEPLPTIVDHLEDSADLSIGLAVLAYGRSPGGDWMQYRAVIKAFRDRAPYVVVKYTTDMAGNALRLLLPSPITAYLSRTDIELL